MKDRIIEILKVIALFGILTIMWCSQQKSWNNLDAQRLKDKTYVPADIYKEFNTEGDNPSATPKQK